MKKILTLVSALVLTLMCGCSKFDGDPITKEFNISNTYTELDISHAFNVTVSDEVTQVTVTAGDRIMPKVIPGQEGINTHICLYSAGDSTPTLAEYDFSSDNSKWNFRNH